MPLGNTKAGPVLTVSMSACSVGSVKVSTFKFLISCMFVAPPVELAKPNLKVDGAAPLAAVTS